MKILIGLILKAIKNAALTLLFFVAFLTMLCLIVPLFNLYASPRESIIDMGKFVHIIISKQNDLKLYMGHSESETGWVEDDYKISVAKIDNLTKLYFGIENANIDDKYNAVRLFIEFDNGNEKIDGKDGDGWVKFKDNDFNYGIVLEIPPATRVQLPSITLKFPKQGIYKFKYGISANGYRTKFGTKTINVS